MFQESFHRQTKGHITALNWKEVIFLTPLAGGRGWRGWDFIPETYYKPPLTYSGSRGLVQQAGTLLRSPMLLKFTPPSGHTAIIGTLLISFSSSIECWFNDL